MPTRQILKNTKARFDFQILESFQAGLKLSGGMVKLITNKKVNITGLYIAYNQKQLQIIGFGNETYRENVPLLLKAKELQSIKKSLATKGNTAVVLEIKRLNRWLKAEIAVVKGRNQANKKEMLKERDIKRETDRDFKDVN
jgi:SsrA-binding protein